jgi:hypothetical protein
MLMEEDASAKETSTRLTSVKYPKDDDPLVVDPVLKHIRGAEYSQHDLAELLAPRNRVP